MERAIIVKGKYSPRTEKQASRYKVTKDKALVIVQEMETSGVTISYKKRSPARIQYMESRREEVRKIAGKYASNIFICTPPPKPPAGKPRYSE